MLKTKTVQNILETFHCKNSNVLMHVGPNLTVAKVCKNLVESNQNVFIYKPDPQSNIGTRLIALYNVIWCFVSGEVLDYESKLNLSESISNHNTHI